MLLVTCNIYTLVLRIFKLITWHKALNIQYTILHCIGTSALHNFNYFNMSLDTIALYHYTFVLQLTHLDFITWCHLNLITSNICINYIWNLCTLHLDIFKLHLLTYLNFTSWQILEIILIAVFEYNLTNLTYVILQSYYWTYMNCILTLQQFITLHICTLLLNIFELNHLKMFRYNVPWYNYTSFDSIDLDLPDPLTILCFIIWHHCCYY